MIAEVANKRREVATLCEQYDVIRLVLFGLAARGDLDPAKSDLDVLVLFDRGDQPGDVSQFFDFEVALTPLFGRKINRNTELSIKSPYFHRAIEQDLESIYGRSICKPAA